MRAAVFLDRDGTLIEHVHYLNDPEQVRLLPGGPEAIRILQALDFACVIITNQSAIGRGTLTVEGLEEIHQEMHRQLFEHGVHLDGVYYCPVAPSSKDRTSIEHPDRKPGPGMLLTAARELLLDLDLSWMVGDMYSDMLAGRNAGCRGTVFVRSGPEREVADNDPAIDFVADNILQAAQLIARQSMPLLVNKRNLVR
jgi:D-glycero-D-manno-heptose 1,7-bisphosphate phosphatase